MPVTADLYIPFDAGAGANVAESGWRAMARNWLGDGPLVTAAAPSGGLQPSAGSGRQVLVAAGAAWVQGHFAEWDSQSSLDIATNTSGSTRVDAIVVELDTVGNEITLDVVQGTPGAGVPSLTQSSSTWQILIGTSTIANNGTSVTVADWRVLSGFDVAGRQIGEVFEYPAGTIPDWALELNGQAVSRAQYASLFALWGTTFGAGNGSSTFNVPDRRGRVPVGQNTSDSDFDTIGETGGAKTHTLTTAQLPSHSHSMAHVHATELGGSSTYVVFRGSGGTIGVLPSGGEFEHGTSNVDNTGPANPATTDTAGSGQAHNNLQPYQVTRWVVRAR